VPTAANFLAADAIQASGHDSSQQNPALKVDIDQGARYKYAIGVLLDGAIAHLGEPKNALHHMEYMFDL